MKVVLKAELKDNKLIFDLPSDVTRIPIIKLVADVNKNHAGYITLDLKKPYKSRSKNQNSMIWAMIQQIAESIGEDIEEVERLAKMKAITKGYPYHLSKITKKPIPESMTKITTEEAGFMIESLQEMASFCGVILQDVEKSVLSETL